MEKKLRLTFVNTFARIIHGVEKVSYWRIDWDVKIGTDTIFHFFVSSVCLLVIHLTPFPVFFLTSQQNLSVIAQGISRKKVLLWYVRSKTTVSNAWLSEHWQCEHPVNIPHCIIKRLPIMLLFQWIPVLVFSSNFNMELLELPI